MCVRFTFLDRLFSDTATVREDSPESGCVQDEPTAAPATESTQVYIGNISWDTDEETLASTFEQFGAVERCNVVMDANGRSRGFAFVTYGSIAEAESAIDALNQTVRVPASLLLTRAGKK